MGELSILESSARSECLKLQQQITSITAAQDVLHSHLANSRARELGYEMRLIVLENIKVVPMIPNGHSSSSSSGSSSSSSSSSGSSGGSIIISSGVHDGILLHNTNCSNTTKDDIVNNINNDYEDNNPSQSDANGHMNPIQSDPMKDKLMNLVTEQDALSDVINSEVSQPQPTIQHVQERAKETQIELDEARASLNDLILEIESVSVEESRSREQSARLLRQMADRYGDRLYVLLRFDEEYCTSRDIMTFCKVALIA